MRTLATGLTTIGMVGLAFLSGCGGAADDGPAVLVPLTGVVKLNDKPISSTILSFLPDQGTKGTGGTAATDAEGKFTVKHRSGKDGIEPGQYRIVFSRLMKPDGSPVPSGESAMDHGAVETIPAKYTNPETTFVATVTEKTEPLKLELKGK